MKELVEHIISDRIADPEHAMRSELDRNGLFELADNIKQNGLINPITVRPKNGMYEVVAGHRRFSACKINGMVRIPCVIRELNDKEAFSIMTAENLERQDVDPVDEAEHLARHIELTGESPIEVAKSIRRSVQYVETRLAVGQMPDYMKDYLRNGDLKLGAALALYQIEEDDIRRVWVDMAVRDGVSVAQAEYWLHGYKVGKIPGVASSTTPPEGYEAGVPRPVEFECAIDGQKYDARLCRTVIVSEENYGIFNAFVSEFRKS
jgi:ParB family transcriptional regulator, chromosome partitioning protein